MTEHEALRPDLLPDASRVSPSQETQGEILDPKRYADLYQLAEQEGLPYFARLGASGDVELFLVFESIDAFSEATWDAVSVECKTYQSKFLAVIWTLSDPLHPLGFPLSFDIKRAEERFMALRMLEQEEVPLHYLSFEEGRLTHIYTEAISFSDGEKRQAEQMIEALFYDQAEALPKEAEVQEAAEAQSVPLSFLSDSVLQEKGTAYLVDFARLQQKHGEEEAQHLLMSTIHQAIWVMRRHARSEVRETSFTIWAAEKEGLLRMIVTPEMSELFEVVHMTEEEANPFSRFLFTLPEFLSTEETVPLGCGAYPLIRVEAGRLYHIELDEADNARLGKLYVQIFPLAKNPYAG
ncbi:hypothetical protein NDK47_08550 [Brevibacillus ruminantium]|uniref:Uncharacterized protein n=1 Tax=Brevibacillus ruminantium TaxID=2950604 RepID=A0ABY4WMN0_9BACL|nr:hypothetical protein [Brevibacillus ruminantium]USG67307.1 hypothetical protein NDK47_08550 [Brevibacillus ruminantium]